MTDLKNICIDCGMCCDGTMFRFAAIEVGDQLGPLRAAGAVFVDRETDTAFLLPCPAFREGCCSIHGTRPAICGAYRCKLLRRYERGEVSVEEAESLIKSTMALRDRVRPPLTALVGSEESLALSDLYLRLEQRLDAMPDPAKARRDEADLLFDIVALRVVLATEFEPRKATDPVDTVELRSGE